MSFGHDIAELVAKNERGLLARHSDWERTKLSEIAEVLNGYPFDSSKFNASIGTPLLRIRDIMPGRTETFYNGEINDPRMFKVQIGDLVVGMDGDFNARVWNGDEALVNQRVCLIRARKEQYSPKFLAHVLPGYLKFINDHTSSVTVKHLSSKTIQDIPLPLPPLAEQKRIVARIDALFAEIAEGEAALAAARKGLDTFRRALLKAAVTGELTKDWRALRQAQGEGADDETGHDLLARIRAERARQAQPNGRGRRAVDAPPLDTSALPALPDGWAWAELDALGVWTGGGTPSKAVASYWENGVVPWVSPKDMKTEIIESSQDMITEIAVHESSAKSVAVGSVLMVMRSGILRHTFPVAVNIVEITMNQDMRALTPFIGLNANIIALALRAWQSTILSTCAKDGTTVDSIDSSAIGRFPIPIPPPTEAAEILRRVSEALTAQADTLGMLDAEDADAARLKQSILKAAFEGRLVPQDPADEPASALLARLKATAPPATEATTKPRRGRGRKPASPDAKPVKRGQRKKPAPSTAAPAKRSRGRKPKT